MIQIMFLLCELLKKLAETLEIKILEKWKLCFLVLNVDDLMLMVIFRKQFLIQKILKKQNKMFKNPLKYQTGGAAPSQEEQQILAAFIE